MSNVLWYQHPASEWKNGLPIGTGRLVAMIGGTVEQERVGLNHEWLRKEGSTICFEANAGQKYRLERVD